MTSDQIYRACRGAPQGGLPFILDCCDGDFELRVQSAIRNIVRRLHDQAVACGCPADLSITLDLISQGLEDEIPDDIRKAYADVLDVHDVEPWVLLTSGRSWVGERRSYHRIEPALSQMPRFEVCLPIGGIALAGAA